MGFELAARRNKTFHLRNYITYLHSRGIRVFRSWSRDMLDFAPSPFALQVLINDGQQGFKDDESVLDVAERVIR